jgi:hypothetical protein
VKENDARCGTAPPGRVKTSLWVLLSEVSGYECNVLHVDYCVTVYVRGWVPAWAAWDFTSTETSFYTVYAMVNDSVGMQATSNTALVQTIFLEGPFYTQSMGWGSEYWIVRFHVEC